MSIRIKNSGPKSQQTIPEWWGKDKRVTLRSVCECESYTYPDYNDAINITGYLDRLEYAQEIRKVIAEHEEQCPTFNGEFNQFFVRGKM